MHELYSRIIENLISHNIDYIEHRHEPVRTSEEAAKVRGSNLDEGAKALIFMSDSKPVQLILQGSKRVNKDKFKSEHQLTKFKMASADEVLQISSVEPGGVPPFGNLFDPSIPVYVDENLLKLEYIEFNAGDRGISIRMKTADWVKVTNPIIANFAE